MSITADFDPDTLAITVDGTRTTLGDYGRNNPRVPVHSVCYRLITFGRCVVRFNGVRQLVEVTAP
jgi:hypothetical protein